ncbi:MAG: transcriptional regulator, AraC family [Paenibacillus sp.]|nr:transcriptional regulator, AraC family [Paenibacillus sp.]
MIRLEHFYFNDYVPNWRKSKSITDMYLLFLVTEGKFNYTIDTEQFVFTKGDVVLLRPGLIRSGTDGDFPPHRKYTAHFHLEPASLPIAKPVLADRGYDQFKTHRAEFLRQRFHQLYLSWIDKSPGHQFKCHGILAEIFGAVIQELGQRNIASSKLLIAKQLEAYMTQHYKEDITIGQLAELTNLSPNYVIRIFKEVNKQTPIEFVHQVRISIAQNLLLHSDMNISEVSEHLGFCDPTYFYRVYKKVTGSSPSTLLKQRNAKNV